MAKMLPVSTSYSGRQLDLEVLQSISVPSPLYTEVVPSATVGTPKIVVGIQKLVQRYAVLFPTVLGTDVVYPDDGTDLYGMLDTGNAGSTAEIEVEAKIANSMVRRRMQYDDEDEETYGKHPLDEQLADCRVSRVAIDYDRRAVSIYAVITSKAGSEVSFIVPTTAGIY